ncbi:MAG TPA: TlpA family protein disulfide reductase [Actinobacteria bacterium]|nr:TlpA family protein disulfide reductase [Actinomycetota bacterium]
MKKKVIVTGIVVAALIVLATVMFSPRPGLNKDVPPSSEDDQKAPDFTVNLFSGKKVSLSDFKGKPLIVNFWASWCAPCREEAPVLVKVAKMYGKKVQFLGIVFQDTEAGAKKFIEEFKVKYPNGTDPSGQAAQDYKITGVPETFFIDANGILRAKWLGALTEEKLISLVDLTIEASK